VSYQVEIDHASWDSFADRLEGKLGSPGEILAQFLQSDIIPELEAEAGSQRNVRTGTYSGTWEAHQEGVSEAVVTSDAPYWKFLEWGTSRGIKPKMVVLKVILDIPERLMQYIGEALEVL
jgi:hypothetical protein